MDTLKNKKLSYIAAILIGAAFWASHAVAGDNWSNHKIQFFVFSNIAIATDWATTANMTGRYDEGFHEKSNILGRYPSRGDVNRYFAARTVLNYILARYLPGPFDLANIYVTTIIHGKAARENYNLGLRLTF